MRIIVAYDVSSDGTRAKVSAQLARWGVRLQRSVFGCDIDNDEYDELSTWLAQAINPDRDVVHVVRQCSTCDSGLVLLGQARDFDEDPFWVL